MPHHDHVRIALLKHPDQVGFRVICIDILVDTARTRMRQENLSRPDPCSIGNSHRPGKPREVFPISRGDRPAGIPDGMNPGCTLLFCVFFEREDCVIKCNALIVVAHDCRDSPLSDRLDDLVRPGSEINEISEAKYCIRLLFIEVLKDRMESR